MQVIGGAYIEYSNDSKMLSDENVKVGLDILNKLSLKIIYKQTGGIFGRKIVFFTEYNELIISKIEKIDVSKFLNIK